MSDQQILFPSEHRDRLKNVPYTFNSPLYYVVDLNAIKYLELKGDPVLLPFRKLCNEIRSILIILKNRSTFIASDGDMIHCTFIDYAYWSSHNE